MIYMDMFIYGAVGRRLLTGSIPSNWNCPTTCIWNFDIICQTVCHMTHTEISMYGLIVQRPAVTWKLHRGLLVASPGHFSDNGCVSVASRAAEGHSTIAFRGKFSVMTVVFHAAGVKMEPVKVNKVIRSKKGKYIVVSKGSKFRFQKILADNLQRWQMLHKVQWKSRDFRGMGLGGMWCTTITMKAKPA